jgi:hypothetical protein
MTERYEVRRGRTLQLPQSNSPVHCHLHLQPHAQDPLCGHCGAFLQSSIGHIHAKKCCNLASYCIDSDCAQIDYLNNHWLLCSASATTREYKDYINYINATKNYSLLLFVSEIVGSIISSAVMDIKTTGNFLSDFKFNQYFDSFFDDFPMIQSEKFEDTNEIICDSFSLFSAMLYSDKLSDFLNIVLTESEDTFIATFCSALSKYFTLDIWRKLVAIVDSFSVPIYLESPILSQVQAFPRLTNPSERKRMVDIFYSQAVKAGYFLAGCDQFSVEQSQHPLILEDRALNILAQAASLILILLMVMVL